MAPLENDMQIKKSSPKSDFLRVRAFKLRGSPDPPETPTKAKTMNAGDSSIATTAISKTLRQTSHSSVASHGSPLARQDGLTKTGGGTPHRNGYDGQLEVENPAPDPPSPLSPDGAATAGAEPWSSAIGRATTAGKSGRVIERLMQDNDRLRREMNLYATRADEEQRRSESIKSALDSLRASNQNLETICDTNATAMARKERKIEDLKADLTAERTRRETAQRAERETMVRTTEALSAARRDVTRENEIAVNATTQYEVLKQSMEHLKLDYETKMEKAWRDVQSLSAQLIADQNRFRSLELINRELEQNYDRCALANHNLTRRYEDYKNLSDKTMASFKSQLEEAEQKVQVTQEEMIAATGRMRQVMAVKKHFKGEFTD